MAAGIVDDFVAIGREQNYRRTVDAAEGDSLAETDEYADAVDALEDERLAHFWADTPALIELGAAQDAEARAHLGRLSALLPLDELPPIAGSFVADGDRLALEVQVRSADSLSFGPLLASGSTPLLQELPGDTWAAVGAHDAGDGAPSHARQASRARSAGSRCAARSRTRPGSTSTVTCSTGSATWRCSCAARRRRGSTAAW